VSQRQAKRVRYYYVPKRKVVVCTTQRAASASMAEGLAPASMRSEVIGQNRVIRLKGEGAKVLLWIRDPLDRIACGHPIFSGRLPNPRSVDDYAQMILSETNPHWSPQTSLHRVARHGFLPTHIYPFESLKESWPLELGYKYPLPHVGKQPGRTTWGELEDEMDPKWVLKIISHWRNDMAMHAIALGSWESRRLPEEIQNVEVAA
jgi:hypothetical protein